MASANQQGRDPMLKNDKKLYEQLEKGRQQLQDHIIIANLWGHLLSKGVIEVVDKDRIQLNGMRTTQDQISELVNFLLSGPMSKYNAFIDSLMESKQEHIVLNILPYRPSTSAGNTNTTVTSSSVACADDAKFTLDDGRQKRLRGQLDKLLTGMNCSDAFIDTLYGKEGIARQTHEGLHAIPERRNSQRVGYLIPKIMDGNRAQYKALIKTLAETEQQQVIHEILGETEFI